MVRYNVAPVGQLPLQEPVPLLQPAGHQDGDLDQLVDCAVKVFLVRHGIYGYPSLFQ